MKYSETLVPILVYFLAVTVTATGELRKVCVIFFLLFNAFFTCLIKPFWALIGFGLIYWALLFSLILARQPDHCDRQESRDSPATMGCPYV